MTRGRGGETKRREDAEGNWTGKETRLSLLNSGNKGKAWVSGNKKLEIEKKEAQERDDKER